MTPRPLLASVLGLLSFALSVGAAGCSAEVEEDVGAMESELATNEICTNGTTLRVNATKLNVREEPSTSADIVTVLPSGTTVKCVGTTGEDGWVKVAAGGDQGWAFGKYLVRSGSSGSAGAGTSGTCAPERAASAVGRYQKAFHDVLAYAEGTKDRAKDGYNVMFSYKLFSSCARHPNQCNAFGSTCSTAAGRYQFLTKTWNGAAAARSLSTFEPDNQERAAAYLISNVRRVTVPQNRAMTAAEFSNAMSKLSYEWASLPPGRYGQPKKSSADMRRNYCSFAGC